MRRLLVAVIALALLPALPSSAAQHDPATDADTDTLCDSAALLFTARADARCVQAGAGDSGLTLPDGFAESIAFDGLEFPTSVRFSPDGRVFVTEKRGVIRVYAGLDDPVGTEFADLSAQVMDYWERGLTGLALHPNFPETPYIYILYTRDAPLGVAPPYYHDTCDDPLGDTCPAGTRLSRLTASGDQVTGDELVMLEDWCQQFPSHSAGSLIVGPDGYLYISGGDGANFAKSDYGQFGEPPNPCGDPPGGTGDELTPPDAEGGSLRAQDVRTNADPLGYSGAILRVDPENPNNRRIVGYGLRNSFRITFRPGTDELWIGDVGTGRFEEINVIPDASDAAVENFGWPCYEGTPVNRGFDDHDLALCESLYADPAAMTEPVFEYSHRESLSPDDTCLPNQAALAGIAFYKGGSYPAAYEDAFFLSDYHRRCIWVAFAGENGWPDFSTIATFALGVASIVDLQAGPGGDLYYVDYWGGTVRRIVFAPNAQSPVVEASATPPYGALPLNVTFDASAADPAGTLSYAWDLDGDGAYDDAAGAHVTHTYTELGGVTVRVRVTGASGLQSVSEQVRITPGVVRGVAPRPR